MRRRPRGRACGARGGAAGGARGRRRATLLRRQGDPRCEPRPTMPQPVLEVAGPESLQDDSGDERDRHRELPACDERRDPRERKREGDEPREAARLRQRHAVRDVHEQPGDERQQQHDQGSAEGERGPAPSECEPDHGQQEQRRHRDGAAPPEHLGGEPEVAVARDDELRPVLRDVCGARVRARIVRQRLVDDRPQPEQHEPDGHEGDKPRAPVPVRHGEERHEHEDAVRSDVGPASTPRRSPRPPRSHARFARRRKV